MLYILGVLVLHLSSTFSAFRLLFPLDCIISTFILFFFILLLLLILYLWLYSHYNQWVFSRLDSGCGSKKIIYIGLSVVWSIAYIHSAWGFNCKTVNKTVSVLHSYLPPYVLMWTSQGQKQCWSRACKRTVKRLCFIWGTECTWYILPGYSDIFTQVWGWERWEQADAVKQKISGQRYSDF